MTTAERNPSSRPMLPRPPLAIFDAIYGDSRPGSLIALGSRRPGAKDPEGEASPRFLTPVTVEDRREMLPKIFEWHLDQTQYLMPNTINARATRFTAEQHYSSLVNDNRPLYFQAKNVFVRELCAIVIDLDVGREGDITAGQALGAALDMHFNDQLPLPSLGAFSGRGAYLWWLLREKTERRPPLNTSENRETWKLCAADLCRRLCHLKADPNAKRLANWFKRPGTIDTKTGREVVYMTFGVNDLARVPVYDLGELRQALRIHQEPLPIVEVVPVVKPRLSGPTTRAAARRTPAITNGNNKSSAPYRARIREIECICARRGGFGEGCRHFAIYHYGQAVERWHLCEGEDPQTARGLAWAAARKLNRQCSPSLSEGELTRAMNYRKRAKVARNTNVAESLGVTVDEVEGLGLQSLVPLAIAVERRQAKTLAKTLAKAARIAKAQAVDAELLKHPDIGPSGIAERFAHLGVVRQYVNSRRKRLVALGQLSKSWPILDQAIEQAPAAIAGEDKADTTNGAA